MTGALREQRVLAGLIFMAVILCALTFLLVCQQRGFDPAMCEAYGACGWRRA